MVDADFKQYCWLMKELFQCLESHYSISYPACHAIFPHFMPFCSVIELLLIRQDPGDPFLEHMHCCMEEGVNEKEWCHAWQDLRLEQEYNYQRGLMDARQYAKYQVMELLEDR